MTSFIMGTDDDRYEMLAARYLAALAKRDMGVWRHRILHQIVDDDDTPPADDNETRASLRRVIHAKRLDTDPDAPRRLSAAQRAR